MTDTLTGFKLFRVRPDGSLGSLFANRQAVVPMGEWLPHGDHKPTDKAHRPGWHACYAPHAPQLLRRDGTLAPDRVWMCVELSGVRRIERPATQGGAWMLADAMRVIGPANSDPDIDRAAAIDRIFDLV